MAHPSIKIDTSVQTTKRGLPDEAGIDLPDGEQGDPRLEDGNTDDVPPFLCQSVAGEWTCCMQPFRTIPAPHVEDIESLTAWLVLQRFTTSSKIWNGSRGPG